jgi:ATP-dependent helicase/nuclease subunit A
VTTLHETDYTPEQRQAILTHDRNLIVVAGAGSGKTRVLVDRFVALLDAHPDWPLTSLVAITFTENAAREMRDRVRQAIEQRIERAPDAVILQRWRDHQAALDSARISTIHSLCASILRANAAEAGIDPGFDVADEFDSAVLAEEAVEQGLSWLVEENHPAVRLLLEYGPTAVREQVRRYIDDPDWADPWPEAPEETLLRWQAAYEDHARRVLSRLRKTEDFRSALMWAPPDGWPTGPDKIVENWRTILEDRDRFIERENGLEWDLGVLSTWAGIKLQGGSAKAWGSDSVVQDARAILKTIRERCQGAIKEIGAPTGEADRRAAELLPLWAEAVRRVQRVYRQLKARSRFLNFSDLETLTRKLLKDHPGVAARYRDAEFKHILVDEFQDTNRAQREIIYALAGPERPGSLFVVGDPKQSIYRFRGADISVFNDVRQQILLAGGQEVPLSTSFRSHTRLVEAFNAIFAGLFGITDDDPVSAAHAVEPGEPMRANRPTAGAGPCLEILSIDPDCAESGRSSVDELRHWEAWTLARALRQGVESGGSQVWDRRSDSYRPLTYGDVAVLVYSSNSMPAIETAFKVMGVPYITVAGKGYFDRQEVADVLNLLKAIHNPADDLALATALRSPLYNLSDDDLLALRMQRGADGSRLPLWSVLAGVARSHGPAVPNLERLAFARESLLGLRGLAGRATAAELLTRALEETAYLATLSSLPDGERRVGNVDKLLTIARRSGRINLGEFAAYLEARAEQETREGEALLESGGAVQIMTIHKSKGLEFPIVMLFDASRQGRNTMPVLAVDPALGPVCQIALENGTPDEQPFAYRLARQRAERLDAAEKTRLLYVAMTRAQDRVIVSGDKGGKANTWLTQLGATLKLPDTLDGDEERLISQAWGNCLLHIPRAQPAPEELAPIRAETAAWDRLDEQPVPGVEPYAPPLLAPVPVDRSAPARFLNATDLALLGEARERYGLVS